MARHEAGVEDHLEESPALVRLAVRPWHEALSHHPPPPWGRLEVAPADGLEDVAIVRAWIDSAAHDAPTLEERVPVSKLTAPLLEALTLDFLGRLLRNP